MSEEKTKVCKYCQSEIPVKAKLCPNCRKKQKGIGRWMVAAVVVILMIAAVAGSGSDKDKPKKVGQTGNNSGSENLSDLSGGNDSQNGENQNGTGNSGGSEDTFGVGDIVEADNLRITFISTSDYISDNQFMQPKDGFKYIQAEFEFENIGKSDEYVSEFEFKCYADGYDMEMKYFDGASISATLSSGKKSKGSVYFEVPVDAKEITIEYETNMITNKKVVFYVLK